KMEWQQKLKLGFEITSGLRYLHSEHILHRDLHDKNILISNGRAKIADFGGAITLVFTIIGGEREKVVIGTPYEYCQLYNKCWDANPANRPDVEAVYQTLEAMKTSDSTRIVDNFKYEASKYSAWWETALNKSFVNYFNYSEFEDIKEIGKVSPVSDDIIESVNSEEIIIGQPYFVQESEKASLEKFGIRSFNYSQFCDLQLIGRDPSVEVIINVIRNGNQKTMQQTSNNTLPLDTLDIKLNDQIIDRNEKSSTGLAKKLEIKQKSTIIEIVSLSLLGYSKFSTFCMTIEISRIISHMLFRFFLSYIKARVALAKQCIIITGAGISCSGGIPDFRSSDGLYNKIKKQYPGTFRSGKDLFDARLLRTNESIKAFNLFMGLLKELVVNAKPTATHFFIKKLADMKKLKRVYTQNIDNLEELVGLDVDWQLKSVKNCQAQQGEAPNCSECEEKENTRIEQGRRPHTIGQLKLTIILYGDSHPKGLEICQIAIHNKKKADCLIIMGTSLRIPGVKALIKNFAKAVHGRKGYVIFVNATDVVTKEWNVTIDYQVEGTCDEWVKLV
ncbi:34489_t:CDS:10, partial [Gigaspora margarita]